MIKSSGLCIAYLHEFPEYALHLFAIYKPRYAMNRRLFLIIDDHPELDYIEWECDPNELLKNMDYLGYAKGIEATEFQQFEEEDDYLGYFMGIMKTDDAYFIHRASTTGCTPWPMGKSIVKINDAYFFQHDGDPVHYITKVEFEFYLERLFRWLKYVVCKNNDIEIIQTKKISPQSTFKSAMEKCKILSEVQYNEFYRDDDNNFEYGYYYSLYPKICSCSIEIRAEGVNSSFKSDSMDLYCDMYILMDALEMQDKISAIESINWYSRISDKYVRIKLSSECSSFAEIYSFNGLPKSIYIINKERLLCLLDNMYDILK